jgi:uncharacterized RDD family membrane protein YckC
MKKASLFVRFFAFLIDILLLSLSTMLILLAIASGSRISQGPSSLLDVSLNALIFVSATSFLFLFYFTYLTEGGGETLGKSVFHIKVVRSDGGDVSCSRALARTITCLLSAPLWFVSIILAIFLRGRMLHDLIAGTQVVEEGL